MKRKIKLKTAQDKSKLYSTSGISALAKQLTLFFPRYIQDVAEMDKESILSSSSPHPAPAVSITIFTGQAQ